MMKTSSERSHNRKPWWHPSQWLMMVLFLGALIAFSWWEDNRGDTLIRSIDDGGIITKLPTEGQLCWKDEMGNLVVAPASRCELLRDGYMRYNVPNGKVEVIDTTSVERYVPKSP